MTKRNLKSGLLFAVIVIVTVAGFLTTSGLAQASAQQTDDSVISSSPAPYWQQTLGNGLDFSVKDLTIRVKNQGDTYYAGTIYGFPTADYASGYGITPIEQYHFYNPTPLSIPSGFDGKINFTEMSSPSFPLNPNRYYKISLNGGDTSRSFSIYGSSQDSYLNGKAYYSYSSYPCGGSPYFNPEEACELGANNGIEDIYFSFNSSTTSISGTETRINAPTSLLRQAVFPAVDGDTVAWVETNGSVYGNIYMYGISTGEKTQITHNSQVYVSGFPAAGFPAISGNKIVWRNTSNGASYSDDIYMYDIASGVETKITQEASGISGGPDIDGERAVWVANRPSDYGLYLHDFSTAQTVLVDTTGSWSNPKISGNKILYLWSEFSWTRKQLYVYDIATQQKELISCGNFQDIRDFDIYGDKVICAANSGGSGGGMYIMLHDLATGEEKIISPVVPVMTGVNIFESKIVWSDDYDIFIYDIATGRTDRTGMAQEASVSPKISGNTVVWYDYRAATNENPSVDIYMYQLAEESPTSHAPTLSFLETEPYAGDGVDPNSGDTATEFTFRVIYTDADNNPPSFIDTFLFGHATTTVPMSVDTAAEPSLHDGNYANGEQYAATARREVVGTHYYAFVASDGNSTVQFPSLPNIAGFPLEIINIDSFVALGDSFSSGFGVPPFEGGTHQDQVFNDCQRSENAYPQIVAEEVGLGLSFHACQGATTKHMYERRVDGGNDWEEVPQLENLDQKTELVTLTIGGNDVGFADVLKECILGFELLPFNTCFSDTKVTDPVQEALTRLDGGSGSSDIKPYDVIYKDIRRLAPIAKGIAVGYPHLFTASGYDRTFLPGGRCEGVKKADQRWMVEKIDELNDIIERNALRNGLLFALPVFDGHELCGAGEEWIFDALSDGAFHPTINGHQAIAKAVTDELLYDAQKTKILIEPFQTFAYAFSVESGKALLSFTSEWPGSDIVTSLQSPSGVIYTRNSGNAFHHDNGATWEHYEITQPETGTWTATLYGADVAPQGEGAVLSVYLEDLPNQSPVGNISWRIEGSMLMLDGGGSHDPDGQITSYDWYVTTPQGEAVYTGQVVQHLLAQKVPATITLVVTDDRGGTNFVSVTVVPIDVYPGSDVNHINPKIKGVLPVAILSSAMFDASTIDPDSLHLGPGQAKPVKNGVHREDVNNDGIIDLMLQFPIQQLGIESGTSRLCMTGKLPNGTMFESCDAIKVK